MQDDGIPRLKGWSEAELDAAFAAVAREVEAQARALTTADEKEEFRLRWLGRKQGRLKAISDAWLKAAPTEAKKPLGQRFNTLKALIETRLESAAGGGLRRAHSTRKPSTSRCRDGGGSWARSIR